MERRRGEPVRAISHAAAPVLFLHACATRFNNNQMHVSYLARLPCFPVLTQSLIAFSILTQLHDGTITTQTPSERLTSFYGYVAFLCICIGVTSCALLAPCIRFSRFSCVHWSRLTKSPQLLRRFALRARTAGFVLFNCVCVCVCVCVSFALCLI